MSALRRVGSWANDQESSEGEDEDEEFGVDCDSAAPTQTVPAPNEVCMYIEEIWSWSLALVVAVKFCNLHKLVFHFQIFRSSMLVRSMFSKLSFLQCPRLLRRQCQLCHHPPIQMMTSRWSFHPCLRLLRHLCTICRRPPIQVSHQHCRRLLRHCYRRLQFQLPR